MADTNPDKVIVKNQRKKRKPLTKEEKRMMQIAKQVYNKETRSQIGYHYHDDSSSYAGVDISGAIYTLTKGIPQGDTQKSRTGSMVTLKSMLLRYSCKGADVTNLLRVIVFQWFQPGDPTVAQVVQSTGSVPFLQPLNTENSPYINVIYDNLVAMTFASNDVMCYKEWRKWKYGLKCHWAEGAATNEKGNVYMCVISDSGVASHPEFQHHVRFRFLP